MDPFEVQEIVTEPLATTSAGDRTTRFLDSSFRQILRNSSWAIGSQFLSAGAILVETALLGRHLGVRQFGVYVLVIAYPEAVQMILDFRTREAMTKYLSEFLALDERASAAALVKVLWVIDAAVSAVAFGIVVATAPFVAGHLVDRPDAAHIMVIYAIGMFFGSLDATAGTILRVFERFPLAFGGAAATSLIRLGLIVAAVAGGAGVGGVVWARVAAEVATTAIMGALALFLLKRALWRERGSSFSVLRGRSRELTRFLVSTNLLGFLKVASSKLDVLIIGFLATPAIVGTYKVAVQFGSSPLLLSEPLFLAIYPSFSRWWALGLHDQIRSIGRRITLLLAALAIPAGVGLAYASRPLLSVTVGHDFERAATPLAILLAGIIPVVILSWTRAAILSMGAAGVATKIAAVGAAVELVLLFVLVPSFGASGGTTSLALMNLSALGLTLVYLRRRSML